MAGGGGSQSTSSAKGLPPWLAPYYTQALGQGQNLEQTGQFSGTSMPVAGFSPLQQQGFHEISGLNPSSIGAANGAVTGLENGQYLNPAATTFGAANPQLAATASGQYLDPASNPYLTSAYNMGAQGIQNNLDSQFGAAGRNVLASAPVQSDQLNNLATQLYGGAYQSNMQNMLNAQQLASGNYNSGVTALNQGAAIAPGVTAGMYTPAQMLLGAGQQQQQQQQNVLNAPYQTADWYASLLGQNSSPFGTATSTVQNNPSVLQNIGAGMSAVGLLGAFL